MITADCYIWDKFLKTMYKLNIINIKEWGYAYDYLDIPELEKMFDIKTKEKL